MEPIAHYILPTIFLLAINSGIDRGKVLRYSPLALLPDIDFFFGHAFLHNIFMPVALSSIIFHHTRRDRTAWMLSMYYLYSHLILDLGFVALLYPLVSRVYTLNVDIYTSPMVVDDMVGILTGEVAFGEGAAAMLSSEFTLATKPLEAARTSEIAPLFTQFGLMLVLLYAMVSLLKLGVRGDYEGG